MLLLELNEFNLQLLRSAVAREQLPNIERLLSFRRSAIVTSDREQTGFLEPWVQWVSIHTGRPSITHRIKHLGDLPDPGIPFLWETLDQQGVKSGIWGAMNGARRSARSCAFFLPDPWTFSEPAHPAALAPLLALPRYLARNYLSISKLKVARLSLGFFRALLKAVGPADFCASLAMLAQAMITLGTRQLVFIVWFEYLSGLACLRYRSKYRPDFCLLFLNSLAHAQHHYWTDGVRGVTPEIAFALRAVDRLLGRVFAAIGETTPILVTNALSQKNTNREPVWILYRQKDPHAFVEAAGLGASAVEPLMTYDAHLFFGTPEACSAAFEALNDARVNGRSVFEVERDGVNSSKLFYRIDFTDSLPQDAVLEINGRQLPFFVWFAEVVKRTGRHIPVGTVFSRGVALPAKLDNFQLHNYICQEFGDDSSKSDNSQAADGKAPACILLQ
jgi:hypothetical protein